MKVYCLFAAIVMSAGVAYADFNTDTVPHKLLGQVIGFKVLTDNPKGTQLTKVGIKKEDVVVAVNGRGIPTMKDALRAYNTTDIHEVTVLRNGAKVTLRAGKAEVKK